MTNQFTEKSYPMYSRLERDELEMERVRDIHPFSQTVKYAQIIDNSLSIIKYDPDLARIYLKEVESYISEINEGNSDLYSECCHLVTYEMSKFA